VGEIIEIKMSSTLSMDDIANLDRQIDQLYDYKPIPEHEVKALCEKVRLPLPTNALPSLSYRCLSFQIYLTQLIVGEGDPGKGEQRAASEVPCDSLW
jgi:hypothetical protein